VTTKPADVCDHVNVAALPSNETEVIGATRLVASEAMVNCVPADGMPS